MPQGCFVKVGLREMVKVRIELAGISVIAVRSEILSRLTRNTERVNIYSSVIKS